MDGIKSKDRVKEHGEVFTPDSIVNDMLDLVDEELHCCTAQEYIEKTYLEPACGDGQFLIRILSRKLEKVASMPIENRTMALLKAVSTIYGVDIQEDNVIEARKRMLKIIFGEDVDTFDLNNKTNIIKIDTGVEMTDAIKSAAESIVNHNIIAGNTLEPDGNMETKPIMINEYIFDNENITINQVYFSKLNDTVNKIGPIHYSKLSESLESNGYTDELVNEDGEEDFNF